jgi:chromosome partitioning protein
MKTIIVSNQKGGIGKTSTATALAGGLMARGKTVLFVDADPQRNGSDTYRADLNEGSPTLADLLYTEEPAENCIQHTEVGDILAGDAALADAEKYLKGVSGYYRLRNRLEPLKEKYDYIIIDTNPHILILLQNALIASDGVITPVACGRYAVSGMVDFARTISEVQAQPNPGLKILGVLVVNYDGRTNVAKDVIRDLPDIATALGTTVLETKISRTIKVEEAQGARTLLTNYDPDCTAARDYMSLIDELEGKGVL